jgi:hypothetical protein
VKIKSILLVAAIALLALSIVLIGGEGPLWP